MAGSDVSSEGAVLHGALREWDYTQAESQFWEDGMAVSIPCQLRFTEKPIQNTERFHAELEKRHIGTLDGNPAKRATDSRPHYEGEVMLRENYKRIKVSCFGTI